jgi:hypothetical protein
VAEIAGAAVQAPVAQDSHSFLAQLTGAPAALRRVVYTEGFFTNFRPDPLTGWLPSNYEALRHIQAIRDRRFKLIRRTNRDHGDPNLIVVSEEFYDLTKGGPPDTSVQPPLATPDWFEQNDLLVSGIVPGTPAARSLAILRAQLDTSYPAVVE